MERLVIAVGLAMSLSLVTGCTQEVDDPAGVQAIKDGNATWDKAWNAGNAEALASLYTADAIVMGPNEPARVGREASGNYRFADIFTKRGGRWQIATRYSSKAQWVSQAP
jgi:ketosteroid isomerase-like protein